MEENKREPHTLSEQEKQILQKLQQVDESVADNIRLDKSELVETRFYEEFTIESRQGQVTLKNVFITVQKNQNGQISYHFRWIDEKNGIIEEKILIDNYGKVYTMPELDEIFGNLEIDIDQNIKKNDARKGNLKGISKNEKQVKKIEHEPQKLEDRKEEKDDESQKIEDDLIEQGEDVEIGKHRGIEDDNLHEVMPDAFEQGKKYVVARDRRTGDYIIVERGEDGKYKKNKKIEPGRSTNKKVYTIDENGEQKECEVPTQSMRVIGNSESRVVINQRQYGEIDMQTVRITPCQIRIGRSSKMTGEGEKGREAPEVTRTFKNHGGEVLIDKIAHKREILEKEYGVTKTDLKELEELDIEEYIQEEADRVKVSKEGFKGYIKRASGKTLKEKVLDAQETIIEEYKGNQRTK